VSKIIGFLGWSVSRTLYIRITRDRMRVRHIESGREVSLDAAMEEAFFLGLRLNGGVDLKAVAAEFGDAAVEAVADVIDELVEYGLLERSDHQVHLTARGRLLSNEVFEKFLGATAAHSSRS